MSGNIFKSLATVSGMTMASRVMGFARQILMAGVIGAGGNPVAAGATSISIVLGDPGTASVTYTASCSPGGLTTDPSEALTFTVN